MKSLFGLLLILSSLLTNAQTVYNPSSYTNANAITIKKITVTSSNTTVNLVLNTKYTGHSFSISSATYIQASGYPNGAKYKIRELVGGQLDQTYTPNAGVDYEMTLIFDKIPSSLEKIDIQEPVNNGWHWRSIEMNNPTARRLPIDQFFQDHGISILANMAHPSNTFRSANWKVDNNKIWVDIYYDYFNTELEITRSGNLFTDIKVLYDNDIVPPFGFIQLIKDTTISSGASENQAANQLSAYLQKKLSDMNGSEMTCMFLSGKFLTY